eukprot:m.144904 g.144904  ORF g.144904 m.144904 type:complete len:410 (+) comp16209_c0_seq11:2924-4153(+)
MSDVVSRLELLKASKGSHASIIKGDLFVSEDAQLPFAIGDLHFTEDRVTRVAERLTSDFQYSRPQSSDEWDVLEQAEAAVRAHFEELVVLPEVTAAIGCWIEAGPDQRRLCAIVLSTWLAGVPNKLFPDTIAEWPVVLDHRCPEKLMDAAEDAPAAQGDAPAAQRVTSGQAVSVPGGTFGTCAFATPCQDGINSVVVTAAHVLMSKAENDAYTHPTCTVPSTSADAQWVLGLGPRGHRQTLGPRVFPDTASLVDVAYAQVPNDKVERAVDAESRSLEIDIGEHNQELVSVAIPAQGVEPSNEDTYGFLGARSGHVQGKYVGRRFNLQLVDQSGDLDAPGADHLVFAGPRTFGDGGDSGSLVWKLGPDQERTAVGLLVQRLGHLGNRDRECGLVVPWDSVLAALPDDVLL